MRSHLLHPVHLHGTHAALQLLFYHPDENVRNYVMIISLQRKLTKKN